MLPEWIKGEVGEIVVAQMAETAKSITDTEEKVEIWQAPTRERSRGVRMSTWEQGSYGNT